jgi:hypothetical protein
MPNATPMAPNPLAVHPDATRLLNVPIITEPAEENLGARIVSGHTPTLGIRVREAEAASSIPTVAAFAVELRGASIVLGHAPAFLVQASEVHAAGRVPTVAGIAKELRGARLVRGQAPAVEAPAAGSVRARRSLGHRARSSSEISSGRCEVEIMKGGRESLSGLRREDQEIRRLPGRSPPRHCPRPDPVLARCPTVTPRRPGTTG